VKYRVSWDPSAFRRLLREWTAAGKPQSGIRAYDAVEELLSTDAELTGESRDEGRRIVIVPPLGVLFRVLPESGEVRVVDAWLISGRAS
jgi:hypothetical protein